MAWIAINTELEYDDAPADPGVTSPFYDLWTKQVNGIRVDTAEGRNFEVYVKCRPIGSTVDTFGEISKSYYDIR